MSFRLSVKFLLLPISAIACVLTTGCANMVSTATDTATAATASSTLTGSLHGGNQPISGSDVRLYAAGTTGYGSAPTLYAVTTSAADSTFGFTRTAGAGATQTRVYGCPTDGTDPQMYITAKGGNTQGAGNGTNTAAVYIAAIGKCSTIANTYVTMNEVTTVGTMAALQQYFAPGNATSDNLNHLGYPNTTQAAQGFANAVATISNLVSLAGGNVNTTAVQTATPTGATAAVTVSMLPEVNKIDTLANIIAACVNTTSATASTNCSTLFTNATPPSSSVTSQPALSYGTATDTLQALYYMLTNPTSGSATNLTNLFNLQNAQSPFQPMAATAPTDWTVGLKYTSTSACATGTANFLAYAYHLAVDATGNLWAVSNATGGNLFELSPAGVPLTCTLGATVGRSNSVAIDTVGNVWVGGIANTNLYKYSPAGSSFTTWPSATPVGTAFIAIDRSGDVISSSAATAGIFDFANGANTAVPFPATTISTTTGTSPLFMGIDTANRVFVTNSSTTNTYFDVYPATDANNLNGYDTANIGSATTNTNGYGSAAVLAGTIATPNGNNAASTTSNTLSIFTPGATPGTVPATFTSAQYSGGLVGPREIAVDGAGNLWVASSTAAGGNYVTGATTSGLFMINEFTSGGAALSPTGTASSTSTVTGGFQKDATVLPVAPRSIVVDPSGNVWVGSNSSTGTSITELVGAGVPVVTPIAAALAAGVTTTNAVSKP